jgi:monovalent cation:H+ antiporter-2, CPA2 family
VEGLTLLRDLAVVLLIAGGVAVLFQRLGQPVLLGYLLAGIIIGPHTPPFPLVRDEATIRTLADLGVVFLLFGLGLEFNLRRLRSIGPSVGLAAAIEMALVLWLGYHAGRLAGFRTTDSLFLGAILSLASSTVASTLFREKGLTREPFAQLALGILIAEDVLIVLLLVLLAGIAMTGDFSIGELARATGSFLAFAATVLTAGLLLVPRLIALVARSGRDELVLLVGVGICFGLALLATELGYSVALGAFVAGAVTAESREARRIERLVAPVRDLFGAVFFVAVGMLLDPRLLIDQGPLVLGLLLLLVVGKTVAVTAGTFLTGVDLRTSLRAGMSLAQIGEFSFIVAQLGVTLGVTDPRLYPIAVAVSTLAIFLNPHLIDRSDQAVAAFERLAPGALLRGLNRYTRRLRMLQAPSAGPPVWRLVRRSVWIIAINVVLVSLLFAGAGVAARWVEPRVGPGRWFEGDLRALAWLAAALVALPCLVAVWRKVEAVLMILAEGALPRGRAGADDPRVERGRRLLLRSLLAVASGAIGLWILALSAPLRLPWPVLLALVAAIGVLARVLWGAMVRLHATVQARLEEILEAAPPQTVETRAALVDLLQRKHPWDVRVVEVVLPERSAAAGRTIGDLRLRRETGVSIVGLHRGGLHLVNPGPSVPLFPGDAVVLMGGEEELARARARLLAERPADEPQGALGAAEVVTVEVRDGSPLAGAPVGGTGLRERYGVSLVGLQRGDTRMAAPPSDTVICSGDVVVLFGLPEAVSRARAWVTGAGGGGAA